MNHRESAIQRAVVNGLRMVLGKYFLIAHVPNHGFTNAGILTSMGMIPGAADIVITGARFSAWMEIKDEGKGQSDKQICFEADCKSRGIKYAVVRSLDEAIAACVAWCIVTRSKDGSVHSLRPSGLGSVERGADLSQRTGADLAGAVSEASEASTGVTPPQLRPRPQNNHGPRVKVPPVSPQAVTPRPSVAMRERSLRPKP